MRTREYRFVKDLAAVARTLPPKDRVELYEAAYEAFDMGISLGAAGSLRCSRRITQSLRTYLQKQAKKARAASKQD